MLGKEETRKSTVFHAYSPGAGKERNLEPYCFDEDPRDKRPKAGDKRSFESSSSSKISFQPFTEYERGLKRSTKEVDEEKGGFLTAMSPKTGEESSSESCSDTPREKSIDPFGLESSSDSGETER